MVGSVDRGGLVQERSGAWEVLGVHQDNAGSRFVGQLSDPIPFDAMRTAVDPFSVVRRARTSRRRRQIGQSRIQGRPVTRRACSMVRAAERVPAPCGQMNAGLGDRKATATPSG